MTGFTRTLDFFLSPQGALRWCSPDMGAPGLCVQILSTLGLTEQREN